MFPIQPGDLVRRINRPRPGASARLVGEVVAVSAMIVFVPETIRPNHLIATVEFDGITRWFGLDELEVV